MALQSSHWDFEIRSKNATFLKKLEFSYRNVLSFRTDRSEQTVQTSLIRVYTVCHSVCIVWTHCCMVEPHGSNFRVITTNFLGVRIIRKFTVYFSVETLQKIGSQRQ